MFTGEPRAIVNFSLSSTAISLKPVNDQQNIVVALDLPVAFAYRMIELNCSITQDVADDWNRGVFLEVTNAIRNLALGATHRHPGNSISTVRRNTTGMWAIDLDVPRYIMQALRPTVAPVITFEAGNENAAAGTAGTIEFFASFFEYEIEQSVMYPIHYPALTLERS